MSVADVVVRRIDQSVDRHQMGETEYVIHMQFFHQALLVGGHGFRTQIELLTDDREWFAAHQHHGHLTLATGQRSEEHTSELQSLMSTSYAVFCLNKKKNQMPNPSEDNEQNKLLT